MKSVLIEEMRQLELQKKVIRIKLAKHGAIVKDTKIKIAMDFNIESTMVDLIVYEKNKKEYNLLARRISRDWYDCILKEEEQVKIVK